MRFTRAHNVFKVYQVMTVLVYEMRVVFVMIDKIRKKTVIVYSAFMDHNKKETRLIN